LTQINFGEPDARQCDAKAAELEPRLARAREILRAIEER
jgi:hypothetical protein